MYLCLPATSESGLESRLSPHFGSAPFFALVDTGTGSVQVEVNDHARHQPGMCTPTKGLENRGLDAVVCRGMGSRAVRALNGAGIPVMVTDAWTVADAVTAFHEGALRPLTEEEAAAGHHHHHD